MLTLQTALADGSLHPRSGILTHASRTSGGSANIRSYTVNHRETDLDFITRLLAQEGIACRIDEDDSAPAGQMSRRRVQRSPTSIRKTPSAFGMFKTSLSDWRTIFFGETKYKPS